MAAVKKKKSKKKLIIICVIVLLVLIMFFSCARKAADAAFLSDSVTARDIMTYHSFTGTVTPVTEENVVPVVSGIKVESFAVKEGDEVKAGDVLVYLDKRSVQEQIDELETSMSLNAANSDLSVKQARNNYYNYRNDLNKGVNSQILTASQNAANAKIQYDAALRNYLSAVSMNEGGYSSTIANAKLQTDNAYQSVLQAKSALELADHNKRDGETPAMDREALNASYEQAEHALDQAWLAYENAVANSKAAAINEKNNLQTSYESFLTAQLSYLAATLAYDAAVRGASEQLATYKNQYDQALLGSDTSLNDLKLADLYEKLEDCSVKSPIDGIVTDLPMAKGDVTTATGAVAVVTDFSEMKVDIKINEYDILGVEEGRGVKILLNAVDREYEGVISKISRTAKAEKGVSYFESEVDFPADEYVRSGMSVEIRLTMSDLKDVPAILSEAIEIDEEGRAYVYKRAGKVPEKVYVECGATDGKYTEITSGLSMNDEYLYAPMTQEEMMRKMMEED
ncbi:MAG: HlyD family efflux transporter periplasmic adaptor subunit [Lachnospiraceae bacterium]|nr:HlyD family efflux transporter periplasmic adaptor subunit [Lachnospiraceae bacterium]